MSITACFLFLEEENIFVYVNELCTIFAPYDKDFDGKNFQIIPILCWGVGGGGVSGFKNGFKWISSGLT